MLNNCSVTILKYCSVIMLKDCLFIMFKDPGKRISFDVSPVKKSESGLFLLYA